MVRPLALGMIMFAGLSASAHALDVEQALALLMDKALAVHITARVTENGEQTIWNMDLSEVTISGRAVTVKLNGSNLVVVANFTPYRETPNSLLLVAQGQTWITSQVDKQVKYATSFRSMPIDMGEKVLFYPLGVNLQTEKYGNINIELEVRVVPYSQTSSSQTSSSSAANSKSGESTASGTTANGAGPNGRALENSKNGKSIANPGKE
ncbi:MAG TPA: hypothetical protein VMW87_04190 [Spirochaetia bacterium]|nr:hypothetical protein [Spirochaetia bacterium]